MKKVLIFILLSLTPFFSIAQDSLDQTINSFFEPISQVVSNIIFYSITIFDAQVPLIVVWLIVAAFFFTFYFRFINITLIKHAIDVVRGKFDNPDDKGEVSHFQALTAALSGTVGLGNIAGVAVAVAKGGPGATFWMILAGFLGMTTKFAECALGVKYRNENLDGSVSGGPMYFLQKSFANKGMARTGKFLAIFFAIMTVGGSIGGGNMFQGNQAAQQLILITGGADSFISNKAFIGLAMAVLVGLVIIGGIKSIAKVTEKIVPFMSGIYCLVALAIIINFYERIPGVFQLIFSEAFSQNALYGGFLGVMIMGFTRAAFSNEAGVGSASIAHSAVKTNEPVSEGVVALLEPFIDTIVICTMTALVTIITGEYLNSSTNGIAQTSAAFGQVFSWFPFVLSFAVILFALSTMISWSYYGLKAWTYLFGEGNLQENSYKLIFCFFIIVGAAMELDAVIGFSDAMIFAMSLANITGLYFLAPELKRDLQSYLERVKNGSIKKHR
jgi:AGCS family alanine or glycine:cation symporter